MYPKWLRILLVICFLTAQICAGREQPETYRREVVLEECTAGTPGPPGPPGPPGDEGEPGAPSTVSTNWRQCSWWAINDGQDSGQVKTCSFTKEHSDTSLYVAWSGNLRVATNNPACCRWYFTFNSAECSNPNRIEAVTYAGGYSSYNLLRPRVLLGYCDGISAGSVEVGFWVGACSGYGNYDCYTGWNSASHIMIEEVTPSPYG
ncbi:collagen triple helix repeat-containing protein 1-like [Diadema antillarum]|uniref:collagen triple helix repeat-containing protein 1-like n=1 Tax=Diadema antillarum TaxID=105358 RepID=UPI003A87A2B5